jgi:hypothetical protein
MIKRNEFAQKIAELELSHAERAIAFLWYYRQTQEYEERSASELASDFHDEDFPKPNMTHLKEALKKSRYTVKGKQKNTFQLDVRKIPELDQQYKSLLKIKVYQPKDNIIPFEWVKGTRLYLEKIVNQINSTYELGLYDCCIVMCRRLMESLIIEVYIVIKRQGEIQDNKVFFMLDRLISHFITDKAITLSRNAPKTMKSIKEIGDTAAHDRVYVTQPQDIDDVKHKYRGLIQELLLLGKIKS